MVNIVNDYVFLLAIFGNYSNDSNNNYFII